MTYKLYREFNEILEEVILEMGETALINSSIRTTHIEEAQRRYADSLKAAAIKMGYSMADVHLAWKLARVAMYEYRQMYTCTPDGGHIDKIAYLYDIPSWNMVKELMDTFALT